MQWRIPLNNPTAFHKSSGAITTGEEHQIQSCESSLGETLEEVEKQKMANHRAKCLVNKSGMVIVDTKKGHFPLRIAHLSNEPFTMYKDTLMGIFENVAVTKQLNSY